jgi:hypothetical protein
MRCRRCIKPPKQNEIPSPNARANYLYIISVHGDLYKTRNFGFGGMIDVVVLYTYKFKFKDGRAFKNHQFYE